MGKFIVIEHVTLDGVMQAPGSRDEDPRGGFAHGGWANSHQDPALQEAMGRVMSDAWSCLFGRTTYEQFAGFWPKQPANPFTQALTASPKYVASTTLHDPLPWANSTVLKGNVAAAVSLLKEREENLIVFGSGVLVRSLMPLGLIDEWLLMIHPIILLSGRRLFVESDSTPLSLRLTSSAIAEAGVVIATYAA